MKLTLLILALATALLSAKTTRVRGTVTKKGTYVAPHARTAPNKTQRDNWSSKPNTNPTTGKKGAREPRK